MARGLSAGGIPAGVSEESSLDVTGLQLLVMSDGGIVSSCCNAPVTTGGRTTLYYVCTGCGQACDATAVQTVLALGEAARAVTGRDLSLWASFEDVAVAYGDEWVGPPVAEFGAIKARLAAAADQVAEEEAGGGTRQEYRVQVPVRVVRAYEEFRDRWFRERGLH